MNEKKPDVSTTIPITSTYGEGGHMLRHYITAPCEGSIVTFLVSTSLVLGGWALTNMQRTPLVYYLLSAGVFIFIMACFATIFFTSNLYHTRIILTAIEAGEQDNIYTRLSLFQLMKYVRLDPFDWLLLIGGSILHCGVVMSVIVTRV